MNALRDAVLSYRQECEKSLSLLNDAVNSSLDLMHLSDWGPLACASIAQERTSASAVAARDAAFVKLSLSEQQLVSCCEEIVRCSKDPKVAHLAEEMASNFQQDLTMRRVIVKDVRDQRERDHLVSYVELWRLSPKISSPRMRVLEKGLFISTYGFAVDSQQQEHQQRQQQQLKK